MAITGRFVLLALVGVVPLLLFPRPAVLILLAGLLAALLTLDLLLAGSPRQAILARNIPATVRLGETVTVGLTLTNTSSRTLRVLVREAWQPSAGALQPRVRMRVGGGQRGRAVLLLQPLRRGDLHIASSTLRSFGPLGLAARQYTLPSPGLLRVLPPFHARKHLASKLRQLRELDGRAAVQLRGEGTEFDSLRDYVRGDDVRSIDWRATARRQAVVVRTWRPERDRRVLLVLDTSRTSAARVADEPRLDTGMEAALLLAALAERGGDRVDFLAFDRRVRALAGSAARGNLLRALVEAMAPLEPELIEFDWAQLPAQVRSVTPHRALVVLLTSLDTGAPEEGLLPMVAQLSRKHLVLVAAVRDPLLAQLRPQRETTGDVYRAAAAERALLERESLIGQLRRLGAEVVDAEPDLLPPRLADCYIRLKAAGRL
ncbi:MAG: hypothetical protein JWO93_1410 [Micrococcaceae bacterium]|nr:hypothetical protein [Micrococcaceae bacterium]